MGFAMQEIEDLKKNLAVLENRIASLENFIDDGDDLTLPVRNISLIVEDLKDIVAKQVATLEKQQSQINHFNQESIKARNQIVYMFAVIIATLLGKAIIPYLIG